MKKGIFLFTFLALLLTACQSGSSSPDGEEGGVDQDVTENPAAPGFNAAGSDEKAVAVADEVMAAMGGRKAWDDTRFIAWNFFGNRSLLWDKHTGRVRIEIPGSNSIYLINTFENTGKVQQEGEILEDRDSIAKYVDRGLGIWINDSYWLVMPFKLKDSGVTLKYIKQDTTQAGAMADVLQLTFEGVGKTPQNKYLVYVDRDSRLITQWDFFTNASDPEPRFTTPWNDYRQFDGILLSGNRGGREITDIAVFQSVPDAAFELFDPVDYSALD